MSGSYYALNSKYNQLLALINASGGGGGGSVNNPMTSDLNAGGFDIVNAGSVVATAMTATTMTANSGIFADLLTATDFNDTTAPYYNDLGSVNAPNKYEIANIPIALDAEGSLLCVLRALDNGFKHTVFFSIVAFKDKSTIVILNDNAESDTPIFSQIEYGEDLNDPTKNLLTFTCNAPSTKTEMAIFQNQQDKGQLTYGSFFVPALGQQVAILGTTYTTIDLTLNTIQSSGAVSVAGTGVFGGTMTAPSANIDTITDRSGAGVSLFGTDLLCGGNSVKNANNVETSNLGSPFTAVNLTADLNTNGQIIRSLAVAPNNKVFIENTNLEMLGGDIENVNNLGVNVVNGAGNPNILFTRPIDANGLKLLNVAAPQANTDAANKLYVDTTASAAGVQNPMIVNLDAGGFGIVNSNNFTTIAGGLIQSNGNFLHDYQQGANLFTVGGDIITFNPETSLKITSNNQGAILVDYEQATRTLSINDSATLDVKASATLSTQAGSTTSINGVMTLNGGDIGSVNRITSVAGLDTGITSTGVGAKIVLTTDNEEVNVVASKLNVKEGDINQTTVGAQGSGTAGSIIKTNGVKGRLFDGALSVFNPGANVIMDGRNHSFLEAYSNQFANTEFPRQTPSGRGSFGVRCRAVLNPTANQFISFRIIPQASQSTVSPTITYSRLTFQSNGVAPVWENDGLTSPASNVKCPALQQNRFLEGSEIFLQAKCVYAETDVAGSIKGGLTYIVSFSGIESDGEPCSGEVRCAWVGNLIQNTKFSFEVLAESVGGVTLVDETELFCDGMVGGALF
tara:strand:+ start:91 stop:2478 length:2388 start_codon:yes stop_codon:yes gene_type:complete